MEKQTMPLGFLGPYRQLGPRYLAIIAALMSSGLPMSGRELLRAAGVTPTGGNTHMLYRLEKMGLLRREPGKAWTYMPTVRFIPAERL